MPRTNPPPPIGSPLTKPEIRIVAAVARGCTNQQIATELHRSPATVKAHLERISHRLGVHHRAAIVTAAIRGGHLTRLKAEPRNAVALTQQQLEIIDGIAAGLTNARIATLLGLSQESVRFRIKTMFTLMGASSRAHLVTLAAHHGYLAIPGRGRRLAAGSPLTAVEVRVVARVARGLSNAEIATGLFLSPHTVRTHMRRIGQRLDCGERAGIVYRAYAAGHLADLPAEPRPLVTLTARQLDVVRGFARGLTDGEIAAELFLSPRTVKTHAKKLFRALNAANRAHAVALACQSGHLDYHTDAAPEADAA